MIFLGKKMGHTALSSIKRLTNGPVIPDNKSQPEK